MYQRITHRIQTMTKSCQATTIASKSEPSNLKFKELNFAQTFISIYSTAAIFSSPEITSLSRIVKKLDQSDFFMWKPDTYPACICTLSLESFSLIIFNSSNNYSYHQIKHFCVGFNPPVKTKKTNSQVFFWTNTLKMNFHVQFCSHNVLRKP